MDLRIEKIFQEISPFIGPLFRKKTWFSRFNLTLRYSKSELQENWDNGVKCGIDIGLQRASVEGQRIELNNNTKDARHKEFLQKFYKLADEYKCAIHYHPARGLQITDQSEFKL